MEFFSAVPRARSASFGGSFGLVGWLVGWLEVVGWRRLVGGITPQEKHVSH